MAGLNEVASLRGEKDRVDIVGHADADGSDDVNAPLSEARAEAVRRLVGAVRLDALELVARGVSTADPLVPGITEEDKARNRRVSFRVHLNPASTSRTLQP
jgi:outer membrane protein OmpA-like peptidoglycan-associated protein